MTRIFAILCTVTLVGCAGLSPAPRPEPRPDEPAVIMPELEIMVAMAAVAEAEANGELEARPKVLLVQDPPIEDSWPAGIQTIWSVRWLDPNPRETEEERWMMLCPMLDPDTWECLPAGLVSRTELPVPGNREELRWVYSGFVFLPEGVSPFPAKSLLMSQYPAVVTDSKLSNGVEVTESVKFITPATPVPEPTVAAGLPAGLMLLAWLARKRLRSQPWEGI